MPNDLHCWRSLPTFSHVWSYYFSTRVLSHVRNSGVYQKFFAQVPDLEYYILYTCAPVYLCAYMYEGLSLCVCVWLLAFDLVRNLLNPSSFKQPSEKATGSIVALIVWFPKMAKFSSSPGYRTGCGAHQTSCPVIAWACVPRDWSSVAWNCHSSPFNL
jgi:hypothetical protein